MLFQKAQKPFSPSFPEWLLCAETIAQRPRIRAYLDSDRRIKFNKQGIFRHYPELDC